MLLVNIFKTKFPSLLKSFIMTRLVKWIFRDVNLTVFLIQSLIHYSTVADYVLLVMNIVQNSKSVRLLE